MIRLKLAALMQCVFFSTIYGKQILLLYNNGPSVLDGNITFSAFLEDYTPQKNLNFTCSDGIQLHEVHTDEANTTITVSFMSSKYTAAKYYMNCSVRSDDHSHVIASNQTQFELKEYLIGKVIVTRYAEGLFDVDEVAVEENISIAVQLYDPNQYLKEALMDYMWSIDYEPHSFLSDNISYNYNSPEISMINAAVSAQLPNNIIKFGYFEKKLTVKVPVQNVTILGNLFIHHGEMLNLNISCRGSSPFLYCAQPINSNEVADNFSCTTPIGSTTCNFQFKHYFQNYGNYRVGIFVSNDVETVIRIMEVVVYNVSKKPQLSTVIIPIVCSLLTLCIIVGGISYYIQQRNQLAIEVANFDFQEESVDSYGARTFFEKVFQSCSCRVCNYKSMACGDELFDEDEPLLYPEGSRRSYS